VLIASVELLPSAFAVLCYMLDAELFPQRQLIPHGKHFVSLMKTLSSAFLCLTENTICLICHNHREWGVTHSVIQEYCILAGVPGVARDEKLRKQIFEMTWRDKGWIGWTLFV